MFKNVFSSSFQSFCASLHQELKEYYRLLSVLHSQVHTTVYDSISKRCPQNKVAVLQIPSYRTAAWRKIDSTCFG